MTTIALFSDLHVWEDNAELTLGIARAVRDEARAEGITTIGFLGDWWAQAAAVPTWLLNACRDMFQEQPDVRWILLPGNHDQYRSDGRNALEALGDLPNVSVYAEPTVDGWGLWVPYRRDFAQVKRAFHGPYHPGAGGPHAGGAFTGVAYWHGAMRGALMNDRRAADDGIDPEELQAWRAVLMGHFHKRQEWRLTSGGLAQYIGSPWQTRRDEGGQPKGWARWDGMRLEFRNRVWGPQYGVVRADDAEALSRALATPDYRVTITVPKGTDLKQLQTQVAQRVAAGVQVSYRPEVESTEMVSRPDMGQDVRAHAERYAAERGPTQGLDPVRLMEAYDVVTGA